MRLRPWVQNKHISQFSTRLRQILCVYCERFSGLVPNTPSRNTISLLTKECFCNLVINIWRKFAKICDVFSSYLYLGTLAKLCAIWRGIKNTGVPLFTEIRTRVDIMIWSLLFLVACQFCGLRSITETNVQSYQIRWIYCSSRMICNRILLLANVK